MAAPIALLPAGLRLELWERLRGIASELIATPLTEGQVSKWHRQVDGSRDVVRSWSGNSLQVVDLSAYEWGEHRRRKTILFREIRQDAVEIVGPATSPSPARKA